MIPRDVNYVYESTSDPDAVSSLEPLAGGPDFRSYTYDNIGNISSRSSGPITNSFSYDGENQLRRTSIDGSPVEDYFYDHSGQRTAVVSRNPFGELERARVFIGDAELVYSASGAVERSYAHLTLGTSTARVINRSALQITYLGVSDNVLLSVAPDGTIHSAHIYGPYGELLQVDGSDVAEQKRLFNDKFRDDATGYAYYGVRYYDGVSLGWTQADPKYRFAPDVSGVEPRRANLFAFSLNNPVRYKDPDGRDSAGSQHNDNPFKAPPPHTPSQGEMTAAFAVAAAYLVPPKVLFVLAMTQATNHDDTVAPIMTYGVAQGCAGRPAPVGPADDASTAATTATAAKASSPPAGFHAPGDVPDDWIVIRGGVGAPPPQGTEFSASQGATLAEASATVPNNQVRVTTAKAIRGAGGRVSPNPTDDNPLHVHVTESCTSTFSDPVPNPVPKPQRVKSRKD